MSPNKAEAEEWRKSPPLIGRGPQMNELRKYPARARARSNQVMAVWGIAGIGKSAVVRDLYYGMMLKDLERRERDEYQQFDKYGWVVVSYPFNMREFYLSLLVDDAARPETYTVEEYCRRLVQDYRCLIVVDGLRSTEEWDLIQASLVLRRSRSVVVVVTTDASVARYCTDNQDHCIFGVKALEAAAASDFFESQFSELLQLSIVQQPPASMADDAVRLVWCQVNGFIREYVVTRQMEENLVLELGGKCGLTTQRTGRHLVVLEDWTRDRVVFESIEFSRLRSLTVFGRWESFFVSESMKMLRVLDLEDALGPISDSDLDKVVELLRRLELLSLRGHDEISRLPASLGHLRHLQSRDVRDTSITSLPSNISKLDKLQYVRAGRATAIALPTPWYRPRFLGCRWRVGVEVPRKSIRKLTALHTLGVVNVDASGGDAMVKELTKLTQLRKLGASGINRHNSESFFSAICKYGHLESLSVQFDKETQPPMDADIVLPWKTIHSLKLYGLQDRLPYHGRPLPESAVKLTKLNLEMEKLEQDDDMIFLRKLPKLSNLRLRLNQDANTTTSSLKFDLQYCGYELPTFEKVKILEIACSSSTLQLTFGSESMKRLELLKLDYTLAADQLPQLNHLPELKEVLLKPTNVEETKIALQSQFDNHEIKPVIKYFD